jgi:hypothetical protein
MMTKATGLKWRQWQAQDTAVRWWALVGTPINLEVAKKVGNFWASWTTISFPKGLYSMGTDIHLLYAVYLL